MGRLKYIIVRKHRKDDSYEGDKPMEEAHEHEHHHKNIWDKYEKKYGDHFSDELSEWASSRMKNSYGSEAHHWTVSEVKSAYERLGYTKPEESTWGDIAYAANMAYADYYGMSIETEAGCIKQAYADVMDPDGYPGKIFNRWLSDVIGKGEKVPWAEFA